jgi:hypothetical protein
MGSFYNKSGLGFMKAAPSCGFPNAKTTRLRLLQLPARCRPETQAAVRFLLNSRLSDADKTAKNFNRKV